jgi:hypothetical protein
MNNLESVRSQEILFHVGYHKTATSWLQKHFFRENVGFSQVLSNDEVAELITDPLDFDFDAARVQRTIRAQLDRGGLVNVVSNETLCGHPFYGGREGPLFAGRIQAIAPRGKILFTIREQKKIIASTYMQYISRGGALSPQEFFGRSVEKYGYYRFNHRHFLYDRLVKQYMDRFGAERVLVVTLESFIRDPGAVLGSIARFAGADLAVVTGGIAGALSGRREGESPVEGVVPVLRRVNHFRRGAAKREVVTDLGGLSAWLYRAANRLGRDRRVKRWLRDVTPVSAVVRERFGGAFGESNRRLQALLGSTVDLAGDGFDMGEGGGPKGARASAAAEAAIGPTRPGRAHEALAVDQRVDRVLPPA